MARKTLPDDKKKIKTGITINKDLINLMDEYLTEEVGNFNRSKYIETLIIIDLKKRGKKIDKEF